MLKAIIFDFDGVIADTEPAHFAIFQRVLAEEGINISKEDYFKNYLALDDRGAFTVALNQAGHEVEHARVLELVARKASYFHSNLEEAVTFYPDAVALIRQVADRFPLAINSGALRAEINRMLSHAGLLKFFPIIVSSEDVTHCKPDPEGYLRALALLNAKYVSLAAEPAECLVIEDSVGGVESAMAAGMKCVAVTNTYSAAALKHATIIISSLAELTSVHLEKLFSNNSYQ